jgi:hypothetical protein
MPPVSHNLVPCEIFAYSCDNFYGAATERKLRNYDRERWAHREVEKKFEKRGQRNIGGSHSLALMPEV